MPVMRKSVQMHQYSEATGQVNNGYDDELSAKFRFIVDMVEPRSFVLDIGCGDGTLLKTLQVEKQVRAQGIDLCEDAIQSCVSKGLFVYHGDLNEGLADFNDRSVDYVIATNTLQMLHKPALIIQEMARVGKKCIISVPNFAYWRVRWELLVKGRMPKTKYLPFEWYDTPNIHLTTIKDFREFCKKANISILKEVFLRTSPEGYCSVIKHLPNLFADQAIFMIEGHKGSK